MISGKSSLDQTTMKRLALAKYIYKIAINQSKGPEPICQISILLFHDSVGLFLEIIGEKNNISPETSFMKYWELLPPKTDKELTQKGSMERLNIARKEFKHHGTSPARTEIEGFREAVTAFMEENTPILLGIEFSAISLVNLVSNMRAKDKLEEAERRISESNIVDSITSAKISFEMLLDDYEDNKRIQYGKSPFNLVRPINIDHSMRYPYDPVKPDQSIKDNLSRVCQSINESFESIQLALKIIALGLDFKQYIRFEMLTPLVERYHGGDYHVYPNHGEYVATKEDCEFCVNFVVETSLRIQEMDY